MVLLSFIADGPIAWQQCGGADEDSLGVGGEFAAVYDPRVSLLLFVKEVDEFVKIHTHKKSLAKHVIRRTTYSESNGVVRNYFLSCAP